MAKVTGFCKFSNQTNRRTTWTLAYLNPLLKVSADLRTGIYQPTTGALRKQRYSRKKKVKKKKKKKKATEQQQAPDW